MNKNKYSIFFVILVISHFFIHTAKADYTETKYPIVLVHGLMGFDTVGGVVDYFHNVAWNLERSGAKVYTPQVSFFNDSETRGIQLKNYIIQNIPEAKVNIFGHSQGAPTARVAASVIPERVASITSISGANKGSKLADVIRGVIPADGPITGTAEALANALGKLVNLITGSDRPQNSVAALETLTTKGSADINSRHGWGINTAERCGSTSENVSVYGHNIKMFSWVGRSSFTNTFDVGDYLLKTTGLVFGFEANDGLVTECSQKMGRVIYNFKYMNHLDTINHIFGTTSVWNNPISVYRSQANRLKNLGL